VKRESAGGMSNQQNRRTRRLRKVDVERIWSAAELEALTPNDRAATIRAGFVVDPADVPNGLINAARRKADGWMAATADRQDRQ